MIASALGRAWLVGASLAAAAAVAAAQTAAAEEDYVPEFGSLDNASLTHFVERRLDAYSMPIARFTRDDKPAAALEGRVRELVYRQDGDTSTLEAIRTFEGRFEELGYETQFDCAGDECGGFDFRFGVDLVEPPAMRFDLADFRFLAVSTPDAKRHASVIASRQGGKLFVQIVAVEGDAAPPAPAPDEPAPAPRAKPDEARLYALARLLTQSGHAALDGIEFEPGSATLIGASDAVLEQVSTLLVGRPDLRFLVVGHTDNQGAFDLNLELSRARAEAVAARLAAVDGVEASQLLAYGVGFLAPRASNATEEGRGRNRRVELVLQQ